MGSPEVWEEMVAPIYASPNSTSQLLTIELRAYEQRAIAEGALMPFDEAGDVLGASVAAGIGVGGVAAAATAGAWVGGGVWNTVSGWIGSAASSENMQAFIEFLKLAGGS